MGYPIQSWTGGGYPLSRLDGVSPTPNQKTDQHSDHLLRGRWCASCVHAGGLSSSTIFPQRHKFVHESSKHSKYSFPLLIDQALHNVGIAYALRKDTDKAEYYLLKAQKCKVESKHKEIDQTLQSLQVRVFKSTYIASIRILLSLRFNVFQVAFFANNSQKTLLRK